MPKVSLEQLKAIPHQKLLKIINKAKQDIKTSQTVIDMFKEFNVDIDELDLIPMCFAELEVSARTEKGIIYLNYSLLEDGDFEKNNHYLTHEVTHFLQQTTGDGPTQGSTEDSYLHNPYEQEGFQYQTEFLSETEGDKAAEFYTKKVLDHHSLKGKERKEVKDEILQLASIISLRKKAGLLQPDAKLVNDIYNWCAAQIAFKIKQKLNRINDKNPSKFIEFKKLLDRQKELTILSKKSSNNKLYSEELSRIAERLNYLNRFIGKESQIHVVLLNKKCDQLIGNNNITILSQNDNYTSKEFESPNNNYCTVILYFNKEHAKEDTKHLTNDGWLGMYNRNEEIIYIMADINSVELYVDGFNNFLANIKQTIVHELIHKQQTQLQQKHNLSEIGGLPSNKIRTTFLENDINDKERTVKDVDPYGIVTNQLLINKMPNGNFFDPNQIFSKPTRIEHPLRDVEFYTRLNDEVQTFKQKYGNASRKVKEFAFNKTIDNKYPENYDYSTLINLPAETADALPSEPSEFFKTLKEKAPGKYQKAVKEFYKAVND